MSDKQQFSIHYTRQEARELLPRIEAWLDRLLHLDPRLSLAARRLEQLMAKGQDRGGPTVEEYLQLQGDCSEILREFQKRQILIKDLQRGLVDFPSILGGREVFLCWERGEEDVEFWHELDGGYGGRERL
ncbi:MAG: DUF2203 domain-containing protein [Verrucomicrobia bacterium]|jgi:hypothetical protein|nr:DUF2203 domain-containing protein [Verrucomicrobiota bacterium]